MWAEAKELWNYRGLLFSMVDREIKIRYKNSFLGFFWSMINPLITVTVLTVVFKYLARNNVPNYSAYILAAYLPYMFFQMAIMDSAQSVLSNLPLIKKIYFPREILPLAAVLSNFIHFLLALGVFFVYLLTIAIFSHDFSVFQWTSIYLPLLLVINLLLAAGLGLLFSALNTFYEDVKYLVGICLYMMFFLSPIMYFGEIAYYGHTYRLYFLYHLNPIAEMSEAYRKILLAPQNVSIPNFPKPMPALPLDWTLLWICAGLSLAIFCLGYHVFNKMKWRFVERP